MNISSTSMVYLNHAAADSDGPKYLPFVNSLRETRPVRNIKFRSTQRSINFGSKMASVSSFNSKSIMNATEQAKMARLTKYIDGKPSRHSRQASQMLLPSPYKDYQAVPVEMTRATETQSSGPVETQNSQQKRGKDLLSIMWNKTHNPNKRKTNLS